MLGNLVDGLEILEGRWWLVGAAAAVGLVKGARPLAKGTIKGYLAAREGWGRLTAGTREGWQNLYQEAATEYREGPRPITPSMDDGSAVTVSEAGASMPTDTRTMSMESGGVVLTPAAEAV